MNRYMQQENVSEAWLVIFDETQRNALLRQKGDQHVFSETDGERTIHVHFIKIRPQPPSREG
jgi:hypothetical protein